MSLTDFKARVGKLVDEHNHAQRCLEEERARLPQLKESLAAAEEAQTILQQVATDIQHRANEQIDRVVTNCLKTVYGPNSYEFHIRFERKRGKTEANMIFVKDGHEVSPDSVGGGIVDVASFALRLSCLMLSTPKVRRLLCVDEPFRNVNGDLYRERTAALMEKLAEDLDFQFIIATGFRWLRIGKVINIGE